jgi:predicted 2-oxoglutarate/Fe(II)-dependent dioxygenase YbiX/peroxiredoxin
MSWMVGDLAPAFKARTDLGPGYAFDTVAGRYVVLLFFGSAASGQVRAALAAVEADAGLFDDKIACFFGVSIDRADELKKRVATRLPGRRFFFDFDRAVSVAYRACTPESQSYHPFWLVLDPQLRVLGRFPLPDADRVLSFLRRLPPLDQHAGVDLHAPVLIAPRVFEPEFCRRLISLYEAQGGEDSGFMRDVDGKTTLVVDYAHKRRSDWHIDKPDQQAAIRARMTRALVPLMKQAFAFEVTRMERYVVACYEAEHGGHFRAHRDNTTLGTAHRRFACTINLNADEYEGGDLRFPEFGSRLYRAPTGGAVVFSCSLLHEATPVTRGRRFAFLPFFYDEAGARLRAENNVHLGAGTTPYVPGEPKH